MRNVKFKTAVYVDPPFVSSDEYVPMYAVNEDGEVVCQPTPESETDRVPQDGDRLELRNLVKYAGQIPEEFITTNPCDALQTARAINRLAEKHLDALKSNPDINE